MNRLPVPLPSHLPERLTITLWDFSWYVRTGPGEPFADLDAAFEQAVHRGYNTVRICAMPSLLFGSGLDTSALHLGPLGRCRAMAPIAPIRPAHALVRRGGPDGDRRPGVAPGTVRGGEPGRLLRDPVELGIPAGSSFAEASDWFDALIAIDPEDRPSGRRSHWRTGPLPG